MKCEVRKYKWVFVFMLFAGIILIFSSCDKGAAQEVIVPEVTTATATTEMTTATTTATTTTTTTTTTTETTTEVTTTETTVTTTEVTTVTELLTTQQQAEVVQEDVEVVVEQRAADTQEEQSAPVVNEEEPAAQTPESPVTTDAPKGHYETVHHDAVTEQVWVVDTPCGSKLDPFNLPNCKYHQVVECYCGAKFSSDEEWENHLLLFLGASDEEWNSHFGYTFWYVADEDIGHYETYIIENAYDEQVWVQD